MPFIFFSDCYIFRCCKAKSKKFLIRICAKSRLFEAAVIECVKVYKYRENSTIFIASKSLLCEKIQHIWGDLVMKKTMNRILSSLLVAVMILTLIPFTGLQLKASAVAKYMWPVLGGYGISRWNSSSHYGVDINSSGNGSSNPQVISTYSGTVTKVSNDCSCTGKNVAYYDSNGKYIGMVTCTTHKNNYGNCVIVANDDGTTSVYGHLKYNSIQVSIGSRVSQGQNIGLMGDSGCSTGVHLHFEIRTGSAQSTCIDLKNTSFLPASNIVDTQAPTYSDHFVSCISASSFNVNATLSDDVGIKDAWAVVFGPDGEHQFPIDANSGFFYHTFFTSEFGGPGTYTVHLYIRDYADNSTKIIYENINAVDDTSPPRVSNTFVSCVSSSSFNVNASLSDNNGIKDVWVVVYGPNGEHQFSIGANVGFFYHTFYTADFGGPGTYTVHLYFNDYSGNTTKVIYNDIVAKDDSECPIVTNQNVSDISSESFKLNATVYDSSGIRDGWMVIYSPDGEHQFSIAANNGDLVYQIETSYYGGPGIYTIHIYFYDVYGNATKIVYNQIEAKDVPIHGSASCIESIYTIHPTCTENGKIEKSCSCGYYEEEIIAKLGHDYEATVTSPTCTEQGYTTYTCSRCNDSYADSYTEALNHPTKSWHIMKNPTATSTGLMEETCDLCHKRFNEMVIPSLNPNYVTGITLSSDKEIVGVGDSFTLTAVVNPETATNKNVLWSSINSKVATVDNGTVSALKPGSTVIVAQTDDGGYKDFCLIRVVGITPKLNTTAVVDYDNGIISGIAPKLNSLDSFIETSENSLSLAYSTDTIGTGTIVNVCQNGEVVDAYTTVIFGDVNGDGVYDGMDAMIVNCIANGLLTREQVSETVYMAADCNHDGVIDNLDVELLQQAGILLAGVDQTKSEEELLETGSVYAEYLNLIDQSVETETTEVVKETPAEEPANPGFTFNFFDALIAFIKEFIAIIKSALAVIW